MYKNYLPETDLSTEKNRPEIGVHKLMVGCINKEVKLLPSSSFL